MYGKDEGEERSTGPCRFYILAVGGGGWWGSQRTLHGGGAPTKMLSMSKIQIQECQPRECLQQKELSKTLLLMSVVIHNERGGG